MAEKIDVKGIQGILTRKTGPLPNWAWAAIGVGAVYVYKRATQPKVAADQATTSDEGYGANDGYPPYAGSSDSGAAPYDAGGSSVGGSVPESIPLTFEGSIPVDVSIARPGRRHDRNPKAKHITEKITALKEGGVTKAEHAKIVALRKRRKALR
jgi:hypothetical protein